MVLWNPPLVDPPLVDYFGTLDHTCPSQCRQWHFWVAQGIDDSRIASSQHRTEILSQQAETLPRPKTCLRSATRPAYTVGCLESYVRSMLDRYCDGRQVGLMLGHVAAMFKLGLSWTYVRPISLPCSPSWVYGGSMLGVCWALITTDFLWHASSTFSAGRFLPHHVDIRRFILAIYHAYIW